MQSQDRQPPTFFSGEFTCVQRDTRDTRDARAHVSEDAHYGLSLVLTPAEVGVALP